MNVDNSSLLKPEIENYLFYINLVNDGVLKVDSEKGFVYNTVTKRKIGYVDDSGYLTTAMLNDSNEIRIAYIHQIIWWKNYGPVCQDFYIYHVDKNYLNNSISNLALWDRSINHKCALTKEQAQEIRQLKKENPELTLRKIAKKYGVSHNTILDILRNKFYK